MIDILSYRQWAISQQFANTFGIMALKLLSEGRSIEHLIKKHTHEDLLNRYSSLANASDGLVAKITWDSDARLWVSTTKNGQNVAMVPVFGALTKRGDLCSYGMQDYIRMIDQANKSEKISAILLDMESPGGTVDGTNEFGLAIKSSKKPIVAYGDGMVASAAYWVASQATEIVANKNNGTEFGSIGVLYIHENYQAYIEKEIGSVEIIRAPQSIDKARINVIEPITEDQRAEIRLELKAIAKEFFSTVKKGRGAKLNTGEENIFTGKMYPSSQALSMGMIDSLDTIQGAINRAGQLSINSLSTSAPARSQVNTSMKLPKLSALLGVAASLFTGSGPDAKEVSLTADQSAALESSEKKLSDSEAENAQLKTDNGAQTTKIAELEKKVTELNTQVTTLTTEKAELQKKVDAKPTGNTTTVIPGKGESSQAADHDESATKKKSFRTPHDDEADALVALSFPGEKK